MQNVWRGVGGVFVFPFVFLLSLHLVFASLPFSAQQHCDTYDTEAERALAYTVDYTIDEIWGRVGASGFDGEGDSSHKTYGEVTSAGVRVLSKELFSAASSTGGDCFADVGCGVGRMVAQVALERRGKLQLSWGIELVEGRALGGQRAVAELVRGEAEAEAEAAAKAATTMEVEPGPPPLPRIEIVHGDFTTTKLPACTSHIFLSSLCFSRELLARFVDTTLSESHFLEDHSPLSTVASIKRIAGLGQRVDWTEHRVRGVAMSWGSALDIWVYRKVKRKSERG